MRAHPAVKIASFLSLLVVLGTTALSLALQGPSSPPSATALALAPAPAPASAAAGDMIGAEGSVPGSSVGFASGFGFAAGISPSRDLGDTAKLPLPPAIELLDSDQPQTRAIRVPEDYTSVTIAVGLAKPGDHILISPGTYRVSRGMTIRKEGIVIRGVGDDPADVVVEGNQKGALLT